MELPFPDVEHIPKSAAGLSDGSARRTLLRNGKRYLREVVADDNECACLRGAPSFTPAVPDGFSSRIGSPPAPQA